MHGRIELETAPGKGSTFKVSLPLRPVAPPAPALELPLPVPSAKGLSVLVVEDDRVSGLVAKRLLERLGIRADIAVDGKEARQMISGDYNAFLLDLNLPDADGIEIAASIRTLNRHRKTFVAIVSAGLTPEVEARGRQHAVDAFLAKPYTASQLTNLVHAAWPKPANNISSIEN